MGLGSTLHHTGANMKTGTVFVLLAFIVMGLEVAWAQKSPVKGEGAEATPADSREG